MDKSTSKYGVPGHRPDISPTEFVTQAQTGGPMGILALVPEDLDQVVGGFGRYSAPYLGCW
jgi:hypothetical protein